jgi:hypothetical protein
MTDRNNTDAITRMIERDRACVFMDFSYFKKSLEKELDEMRTLIQYKGTVIDSVTL